MGNFVGSPHPNAMSQHGGGPNPEPVPSASVQGGQWYQVTADLDLYDRPLHTPHPDRLATQAAIDRYLQIMGPLQDHCWPVQLLEDGYQAWLRAADCITAVESLPSADTPGPANRPTLQPIDPPPPPPPPVDPAQLPDIIRSAIAWSHAAAQVPNRYRWGGTVAPHYDCSGLMQAAFAQAGLWLPRDAYQQEAFLQPLPWSAHWDPLWQQWQAGDLVFFGPPEKATHVGLYLGEGRYLHSSGQAIGRNGIGIDCLDPAAGPVSRAYFEQLRGAGRITRSCQPVPAPSQ